MGLQLLVNPINFKNAKALINLGVDQLFVGLKNFSIHCECHLSLNEIKKLVKIKNVTKIFININRYFFENEINALTKILLQIAQINIDGIIFSDFAIPQILHEHKIKKRLTYNPETLVNNYGQFDFY
jgi:collagenase-like PrtC family protease